MPRTFDRKRKRHFYVMMTDDEIEFIEEKMRQSGIKTKREYIQRLAKDGYTLNIHIEEMREIVTLLRNATNNINQIAKRVNSTSNIYREDITDIKIYLESVWRKLDETIIGLTNLSKI